MKIAVCGLWHLGTVTAACLAEHFTVTAHDADPAVTAALREGRPAVSEPGLAELVAAGLASGRLKPEADLAAALRGARVVWLAYDTPVDADDEADVPAVLERARACFPHLEDGAVFLVSSQLPVGSTAALAAEFRALRPGADVGFAYSPENLRLGGALAAFRGQARVVLGVSRPGDAEVLAGLWAPWKTPTLAVRVESAEMAKHALNGFLGLSVAYANELARLCETLGADAAEVERALKSEPRVGPKAYLKPGAAFAGGTLARDLVFLGSLGTKRGRPMLLAEAALAANAAHRAWPYEALRAGLGGLAGKTVALWGLAYRPGTDTLRRSAALELAARLTAEGARVRAWDPLVGALPDGSGALLTEDAAAALDGADALAVFQAHPAFAAVTADEAARRLRGRLVVDPDGTLGAGLGADPRFAYRTVGRPSEARA
jgi:UDPglucose 6-dehydrogenase